MFNGEVEVDEVVQLLREAFVHVFPIVFLFLLLQHVLHRRHAHSPSHKVHAVKFLNHVFFDPAGLSEHVLRELQRPAARGDVHYLEHEALVVRVVGDAVALVVLQLE